MALLVLLLDVEIANACPTCKDTLGLHAIRMQYGYALSIGFMMLVPFSILGGWGIVIYRLTRGQASPSQAATPESQADGWAAKSGSDLATSDD